MRKQVADEILELAESSSRPIALKQAAAKLGYGNSRGVAKCISATYSHFDGIGDTHSKAIIAKSFVDRNGEYPWCKSMKSLFILIVTIVALSVDASGHSLTSFVGFELGAPADSIFDNDRVFLNGARRSLVSSGESDGSLVVRDLKLKIPFRQFSTVDVYVTPTSRKIFKVRMNAQKRLQGSLLLAMTESMLKETINEYTEFATNAADIVRALIKKYNVSSEDCIYKDDMPLDSSSFKLGGQSFSMDGVSVKYISLRFKESDSQIDFFRYEVPLATDDRSKLACSNGGMGISLIFQGNELQKKCTEEYMESERLKTKAVDEGDIL